MERGAGLCRVAKGCGAWWNVAERGGTWWNVVERGGTWWDVVERGGRHPLFHPDDDLLDVEASGGGLEERGDGLPEEREDAPKDDEGDDQGRGGVDPGAEPRAGQQRGDHDGERSQGILSQVEEGAPDVDVLAAVPFEEQGGSDVRDEGDEGDGEHHRLVHGRRGEEAEEGAPRDQPRHDHEGGGVQEGGEDLGPAQAVGEPAGGGASAEAPGPDRDAEGGHVAEVVDRVGEESEAPGKEPARQLGDGDGDVEAGAHPEAAVNVVVVGPRRLMHGRSMDDTRRQPSLDGLACAEGRPGGACQA